MSEVFINSKNAVPVLDRNELKGHTGSTFHRVFVPAGRTETAVTAERDKFHVPTVRTTVHGTTKSGIAAMDHFVNVSHLSGSGMEGIFNFFIIVCKDFL